jgi:hypothetical protein
MYSWPMFWNDQHVRYVQYASLVAKLTQSRFLGGPGL